MAASGATKQDQQLVLAPCSSVSPLLTSIPLPRFFLGPSLLPPSLPCTLTGWSPKPSPDLQPLSSYDWLGSWPSLPPAQKAWPRRLSPLQFRQIPVQTQSKPPSTTLSRWATHPAPVCIWRPQPRRTDAWGISPLVHLTDGYDNNDFQAVECNLVVIWEISLVGCCQQLIKTK